MSDLATALLLAGCPRVGRPADSQYRSVGFDAEMAADRQGIGLLIVDDHVAFCQGLASLFVETGGVLPSIALPSEAQITVVRHPPAMILLGCSRPQAECLAQLRALRAACPGAKFVVMASLSTPLFLRRIRAAGAAGFVARSASFEAIDRCIRRAFRGEPAFPPVRRSPTQGNSPNPTSTSSREDDDPPGAPAARAEDRPSAVDDTQAPENSPLDCLTARELQVLRLVASGMSVRECARALNRSEHTIDNHKTRIMRKLGVHRIVDLTRLAIREGLISPD